MNQKLDNQWTRLRAIVRGEIGETAFNEWIKVLTLERVDGDEFQEIHLSAPSTEIGKWVKHHYLPRLSSLWKNLNPQIRSIYLDDCNGRAIVDDGMFSGSFQDREGMKLQEKKGFERASIRPNGDFSFEDFVVGESNKFAFNVARCFAEGKESSCSPLFICGGVGMGKTHLLHAAARYIIQHNPNKRVAFLSAEKFMQQFVRSVRDRQMIAFKDFYRSIDILLLDDMHFVAGRKATQEELLHTFNALFEDGGRFVVTADKPPGELEDIGEPMKSRLSGGIVTVIKPTDFDMRCKILSHKRERSGIDISDDVLMFLAKKITNSIRELEGALNRLTIHSGLTGRGVTMEIAEDLLDDLLRTNARRITIDDIQRKVSEHYNIKISEMSSPRRSRVVTRPRQVAMYLAKQLTSRSLPEIGRKFGGRDHTTVMHAVKKVEELRNEDNMIGKDIQLLIRVLSN